MNLLSSTLQAARVALLPAVSFLACTASYQSLYEGDVRFEHCYKLDEERTAPVRDKQSCWQEWSRLYTYGQTRDRIEYALARGRALAHPGENASDLDAGAPLRPAPPIACPMPTSAFVAPPQTLSPDAGVDAAGGAGHGSAGALGDSGPSSGERPTLASAPGATCSGGCAKSWLSCADACHKPGCQTKCDESYRACMRGCF